MKKFKRFAALVLAGVMALCMLTACSGVGTQMDKTFVDYVNGKRSEKVAKLDKDLALSYECAQLLTNLDENGKIVYKDATTMKSSIISGVETNEFCVVLLESATPDKDGKVPAKVIAPADLPAVLDALINQQSGSLKYDEMTAIGISTRTFNGQTYVAVAVRTSEDA